MEDNYLFMIIICILLIIIFILLITNRKIKNRKDEKSKIIKVDNNVNIPSENVQQSKNTINPINDEINKKVPKYSYPFKKVYLLTKNEWNFFKRLKLIIDKYNLSIIAKIRLADLIEVDNNKSSNYQEDFDRIKSKHIDFAIVKSDNMEVKLLLELDDNSHNSSDRISRDMFIDKVCEVTGYKLIRTTGDTTEIERELINNFYTFKKPDIQPQKNNADSNINEKILKSVLVKVNKIEKLLSEVDEEPYIIEKNEK